MEKSIADKMRKILDRNIIVSPITQRRFRNRHTGEIVTQVPLLEIRDYDEVSIRKKTKMMKKCAVCRANFVIPSYANNADQTTLCPKCRQVFSISDSV